MDWGMFQKIVRQLYKPVSVSLHLFGEPLLYPYLREAIELLKSRKHTVSITTNGILLEERKVDLKKADQIIWSYNSQAKISYDTARSFKHFIVRSIRQEQNPGIERWAKWPNREARDLHNYGGSIDLSSYGVPSTVKRWPCYHLWLAPAVSLKGTILACCADVDEKLVLGNIEEKSISEIWNSHEARQLRWEQLNGHFRKPCKDCDVWKSYPNIF